MPRGKPRKMHAFRLDPDLVDEVRAETDNLAAAVEEALRDWLAKGREGRAARPEAGTSGAERCLSTLS